MTREHFNAVIVGSGFGGAVTACRLASEGFSVCVLERGRPYPPGSFARTPAQMRANFWDPSERLYGMYNVWSFKHINALVASGLGGGSLIYANVLLRKDEKWFVKEPMPRGGGFEEWPLTRAMLDRHYDAVEQMMNVQRYPVHDSPYNLTPKTHAMEEAGKRLKLQWQLPPLAVTFANRGQKPVPGEPIEEPANLHGRTRYTCRLTGECDAGCNYGSKNTLDFNYLTEAWRKGAQIRTLCEVSRFGRRPGGGYHITYREHQENRERGAPVPEVEITADLLVLAAGTLGTTYLLLKNRDNLPGLSPALGNRFCGNGDLLTFVERCEEEAEGVRRPRPMDASSAPVITSALRMPDAADGGEGRGFYIQDAGYPAFVQWILELTQVTGVAKRSLSFGLGRVKSMLGIGRDPDIGAEISELLGSCVLSGTSLPLLGMGRDVPDGRLTLNERDGRLDTDWKIGGSKEYFDRLRSTMKDVAEAMGGKFRDNPIWYLNQRVITVHPLGGAVMGRDAKRGVVDSFGEVFNHPGLFVVDGAAMPGPVGANPSLTIAAFADRAAERIFQRRAQLIPGGPQPVPAP